ncbi:MAG: glutamine amidotransferase [Actinomycetota bacterium]|nr:glutamine amidotransferase [Actinomycetota bacterium]
MSTGLTIVHLYPDLLRTYGDYGNVLALRRRLEWRGLDGRVVPVSRGGDFPSEPDMVFIGGGSDRVQRALSGELERRKEEISDAIGVGAVVLGVCGGYQLLGHSYTDATGTTVAGMGLLDVTTVVEAPRLVGRVVIDARFAGHDMKVAGFENHGGRTSLGPGAAPLGKVARGFGNNGADGTEGAVQGNVVGTYLHGPLLPTNPALCDALLRVAFSRTGARELAPLDDRLERAAHDAAELRR